MPDRIRYYLDQHVDPAVADGLRQRGVDALGTGEAGNCSLSDPAQLAFARKERRVLVTLDHGFLALHAEGVRHAGIVYAKQGSRTVGQATLLPPGK